jgi:hypothetical protein
MEDNKTFVRPIDSVLNETLKTAIVYELLKMSNLSKLRYFYTEGIYNIGSGLCDVLWNIGNFYDPFNGLAQSIADDQVKQMQATEKQNYQLMMIVCVVLHTKLNELDLLIDMMVNMDKQSCGDAAIQSELGLAAGEPERDEDRSLDILDVPVLERCSLLCDGGRRLHRDHHNCTGAGGRLPEPEPVAIRWNTAGQLHAGVAGVRTV